MNTKAIGLGRGVPLQPDDRLCRALGAAFGVTFVRCGDEVSPDLSGVILSYDENQLSSLVRYERPLFTVAPTPTDTTTEATISFTSDPAIDLPFRDCQLIESEAPVGATLTPRGGERVLATTSSGPIWCTSGSGHRRRDRLANRWPQLPPDAVLRDAFRTRRFCELLPLVQFLSHVTRDGSWQRPQPRATFLLDDPNLHAPRYGYLDYEETLEHVRRDGFHLAIAMVPLDTWFTHGRTAALFRKRVWA